MPFLPYAARRLGEDEDEAATELRLVVAAHWNYSYERMAKRHYSGLSFMMMIRLQLESTIRYSLIIYSNSNSNSNVLPLNWRQWRQWLLHMLIAYASAVVAALSALLGTWAPLTAAVGVEGWLMWPQYSYFSFSLFICVICFANNIYFSISFDCGFVCVCFFRSFVFLWEAGDLTNICRTFQLFCDGLELMWAKCKSLLCIWFIYQLYIQ